jgi:hypothetical protein
MIILMLLVIYIYPLILKLCFSELSVLIAPSGAPPYNNSPHPRELPALYTRLSSQSKLESSTIEALPSTLPILPATPRLNRWPPFLLFLPLYRTNKAQLYLDQES